MREPRFDNLLKVLRRERPDRPTLFEFAFNSRIAQQAIQGEVPSRDDGLDPCRTLIAAFAGVGYDYVKFPGSAFAFPKGESRRLKSRSLNEGSLISDRAAFERYEWPDPDEFDYERLSALAGDLPDGMKIAVNGPGGVLENAIQLVGFDNLCLMVMDDPELAQEIFNAVGWRLTRYYEICLEFDSVGAIISNDDWGFRTQTMLSPAQMRAYVFPWHTRIVAAAHRAERPAILHSCGNLERVMDDVVEDMQFDGKHSFEDTIQPVEEAYDEWHDRVAILGGIDVDFVCRSTPEEVYRRSKAMLERAESDGAYALGTGNSVPDYVPDECFFAMVKAATEA